MKRLVGFLLLVLAFIGIGCGDDDPSAVKFTQYADEVIAFSEEYNPSPDSWSAFQLLGPPNVYPNYGDIEEAWTSEDVLNGRQYLVLGFDTIQTVTQIDVYETSVPGSIDTVYLRNSVTQQWNKVYTGTAAYTGVEEARIFSVKLNKETSYTVDAIRLALDTDIYDDWVEIDAVSIKGNRKK
jgi:hypothetical protein